MIGVYLSTVKSLLGMQVYSLGMGITNIPVIPEIIEGLEQSHENFNEQALYNHLSGYFIMVQGFGESLGPLMSSLLSETIGL